MTPFDFINTINSVQKNDLMADPAAEAHYVPFVINRSLSYFADTIAQAQAMNLVGFLPNKLQYHYLLNTVRPSKRFAKWAKKEVNEDLDVVKQYYGFSNEKAIQALRVLTQQQINIIKTKLEKGGLDEKSRNARGGATQTRG